MTLFLQRLLWSLLWLAPAVSWANLPLSGSFQADKVCPALHSIKKNTNPDNVFTVAGQSYPVRAQNRAAATHYLLDINDQQRWVARDCGRLQDEVVSDATPQPVSDPRSTATGPAGDFLLAVSWQAAFCQTHQQKPECQTQTAGRYDASHLALHGLWPQPKNRAYCNISTTHKAIDRRGAWHLLPQLAISLALRQRLDKVMPGTASQLQRHEWYKHGSCYGSPEVYFRDSLLLMEQLNSSAVQQLFAANIGKTLTTRQIRKAFDDSFGAGSGSKVNVRCSGRLLAELWVNLRGQISQTTRLGELLRPAADAGRSDCDSGVVDTAGF